MRLTKYTHTTSELYYKALLYIKSLAIAKCTSFSQYLKSLRKDKFEDLPSLQQHTAN